MGKSLVTKLTPPLKGLEIWACEWEDAHWDGGEMDKDDVKHRPVLYVSVGILLRDDDVGFLLATDISESGTYRGFNFVPAKMVTKKWKIGSASQQIRRKRATNALKSIEDMPASVGD